eukprot:326426_1
MIWISIVTMLVVIITAFLCRCICIRRRRRRRINAVIQLRNAKKKKTITRLIDPQSKQIVLQNFVLCTAVDWINGTTKPDRLINNKSSIFIDANKLFMSGDYNGYYTYKRKTNVVEKHHPTNVNLEFVQQQQEIIGSGTDNVGDYTMNGVYSINTLRIALRKKYIQGTGNSILRDGTSGNKGHFVEIRLQYDPEISQFVGQWYICISIRRTTYGTYSIGLSQPDIDFNHVEGHIDNNVSIMIGGNEPQTNQISIQ